MRRHQNHFCISKDQLHSLVFFSFLCVIVFFCLWDHWHWSQSIQPFINEPLVEEDAKGATPSQIKGTSMANLFLQFKMDIAKFNAPTGIHSWFLCKNESMINAGLIPLPIDTSFFNDLKWIKVEFYQFKIRFQSWICIYFVYVFEIFWLKIKFYFLLHLLKIDVNNKTLDKKIKMPF